MENQYNPVVTENPIHVVPPVGFELESWRWKTRKGTTTSTLHLVSMDDDVAFIPTMYILLDFSVVLE